MKFNYTEDGRDYPLEGTAIQIVHEIREITSQGVTMLSDLSFKEYVEHLCRSASMFGAPKIDMSPERGLEAICADYLDMAQHMGKIVQTFVDDTLHEGKDYSAN